MIKCKYEKLVPVSQLVPHPRNPHKHSDEQINRLCDLIKYQGVRHPVIVSKDSGFIVVGHGRLESMKRAGLTEVPVDYQDFENEAQEYAFIVSDNAIGKDEWASLDQSLIMTEIKSFDEFNIDLLGIKDFSIVEPLVAQCDEDEVPEQVPTVSVLGDIYELGQHRLMCGDSTSIDAVEKLMNGDNMDITFTSPPYNAAKNGHLTGHVAGFDKKYQNSSDELSDDDFLNLLSGFTSIAIAKSKYCFVNIQLLTHNRVPLFKYQEQFQSLIKDVLIWNKRQCPPNIVKGAFNTKWEYIFCFSEDNKTRGFPCDWRGQHPNVIETESNAANEFADTHKAGFPVSLPFWFIEKFDFVGSVYDPFGGTGTTLIACEKTNRKCYMMELDPHYCDVIVSRYCKYTGNNKIKRNGEEIEWNTTNLVT